MNKDIIFEIKHDLKFKNIEDINKEQFIKSIKSFWSIYEVGDYMIDGENTYTCTNIKPPNDNNAIIYTFELVPTDIRTIDVEADELIKKIKDVYPYIDGGLDLSNERELLIEVVEFVRRNRYEPR